MITAEHIADAVRSAIPVAARTLRPDVENALSRALITERSSRGRAVLGQLLENARIAREDAVPLCQDTGSVRVLIDIGVDECLCGDVRTAVDEAVADAYEEAALRMSVVRDALFDRTNTGNNTPAFVDVSWRPGSGVSVHVMLKGGGSDNASRLEMLSPDEGVDGVIRVVLETVEARASGACPPLLIGVGVGSTFDAVAALAKKALFREVGSASSRVQAASLESAILSAVNATGIGPAGLGGDTTALAVHVESAPCHIAALPVAVNLGCCAMRSVSLEVTG
jgi:fumarate hydratase class I/fumarate hydratase subunit alpha